MSRQNTAALLQMLRQMQGVSSTVSKNIKITKPLLSQQEAAKLHPNIKKIYQDIFTFKEPTEYQLLKNIPFKIQKTDMPICNKTFNVNQLAYSCLDCIVHQSAVQCLKCFENSNHKGHRYLKITSSGGNCDCGNFQAYKQSGFCKFHPGKADSINLQSHQIDQFELYFGHLYNWYFMLLKQQAKKGDQFGVLVAKCFFTLNKQSLYYNTLTAKFLCQQVDYIQQINEGKNETFSRMDRIFRIPYPISSSTKKQFCKLYFEMFSLKSFKYQLTKSYIKAYNAMLNFENGEFKDLFIQLLANTQIFDKCLNDKIFVNIYERKFHQENYYDNLVFLTSIKKESVQAYFKALISQSFMKAQFLEIIQNDVEKGTAGIYQGISNTIEKENYYMILKLKVLKSIHEDKNTIVQFLKQLKERILSKQHESYKKNKIILPYHRIFAIGLLFYFNGDFQSIKSETLLYQFQTNKQDLIYFLLKCTKVILKCFWEFSLSFCRKYYFDLYLNIYISSSAVIRYDLLLLRQCAYLLYQLNAGSKLEKLIIQFLTNQQKKIINNDIQLDSEEQVKIQQQGKQGFNFKTIPDKSHQISILMPYQHQKPQKESEIFEYHERVSAFIGLLVQSVISNRQQLILANENQITVERTKQLSQQMLQSFFNLMKVVTTSDNKTFLKQFIGKNYNETEINKTVQFDHETKKLKAKKIKGQRINFSYYQSLSKLNTFFPNQLQNSVPDKIQLSSLSYKLSEVLLGDKLMEYIVQSKKKLIKNEKIMSTFLNQLAKIYFFKHQKKEYIISFMNELKFSISNTSILKSKYLKPFIDSIGLFNNEDYQNQQQQKQMLRKKKMKQIMQKKMQAIREKQNKVKKQLEKKQIKMDEEEQDNKYQDKCLICQQINSQQDVLCQIVRISNQNYFLNQFDIGEEQTMISMTSCNHLIHFKCFLDNFGNKELFLCPFCKRIANIVVPISQKINDLKAQQTLDKILTRLEVISNIFSLEKQTKSLKKLQNEIKQRQKRQFQQDEPYFIKIKLIISLLISFIQLIGFKGLEDYQLFYKIHQKLAKSVLLLLKRCYQILNQQEKQAFNQELTFMYKKWAQKGEKNQNFPIFKFIYQITKEITLGRKKEEIQILLNSPQFGKQVKILIPFKYLIQSLIFNIIFPINESSIIQEQSFQKNFWSNKLKKIFSPPDNIYQLIKLRDKFNNCKNGHQIIMCCLCGSHYCYDCKQFSKHTINFHAKKCVYFSFMNGFIIYDVNFNSQKINIIYENSIGKSWQPSLDPQGFILDKQGYENVIKQIIENTFLDKALMKLRSIYDSY